MPYLGRTPNTGIRNRFIYTATASQTTFSGADTNGATLKYQDAAYVDVYQNGVLLAPADYTATSKTSVVLDTGATVSDTIEIIVYDIGSVQDTVSKANGGTFESNITINGNLSISGTVDGRDVATDGTKLDGIEANATADQTASEILTAIKTVDGTGSGLDADTVDGIEASSFLQGNETITLSGDVSGSGTTSIVVTVADDSHNHVISNVDGLQTALDAKAPLASPTFTGTPLAPTATSGTNTTQIATTAFVQTAVSGLVDSAPTTLDTLNELAAALGDDANFSTTVTNSIATKLPLAGGTMTGNIVMSGAQTVDGRDLSVDGAKLDGIESGATADQTASEILTAIKTVDGAGSGLDADTLDGIQAASFLQANQTITLSGDASGSGTTSIVVTVADDSHNHIISNVDGLQTALDAKLASSSYTAADVLTKIKTVDGAGSGLDADLLDGQSGAYYLDYNNFTNTPSVSSDANTLDGIDSTQFLRSDTADTKTSGDLSFSDNVKATFGNSADLQIYHDGSNSVIKDAGTGNLNFLSDQFAFKNAAGTENQFVAGQNGAVTLYYDNAAKMATASYGVDLSSSTEALLLAKGTTAQRPSTAVEGQLRFNTTENQVEVYNGFNWSLIGPPPPSPIQRDNNTWFYMDMSDSSSISGSTIVNKAIGTSAISDTLPLTSYGSFGSLGGNSVLQFSADRSDMTTNFSAADPFAPTTHGISIGCLFYHNQGTTQSGLIHYGDTGTDNHLFVRMNFENAGGYVYVGEDTNTSDVWTQIGTGKTDGNWYFLVVTVSSSGTLKSSWNGATLTTHRTNGTAPSPTDARFGLCGDAYGDNASSFSYATAFWYKGELTQTQITNEYNWLKKVWTGTNI